MSTLLWEKTDQNVHTIGLCLIMTSHTAKQHIKRTE